MVTAEAYPLVKTGGLADVCAALPKALEHLGVDVRLLAPAYPCALEHAGRLHIEADIDPVGGIPRGHLLAGTLPGAHIPIWLLHCPELFQRPGTPYQDPDGNDWPDNDRRFAALCHAATALALGRTGADWRPDIVHCHDWHAGLVPYLLDAAGGPRPHTVFTVHNAAFQGNYPMQAARALGLPADAESASGLEFYGQLSFLKAGIAYADKITTVSPAYARELRTQEFGCGMEGVFEGRAGDLVGIMNGIDTEVWNPRTDPLLACRYSRDDPEGKVACKRDLQQRLGLPIDASAPVAMFANRVTVQKMADLLVERLPAIMRRHPSLQFAILGSGDRQLERRLVEFGAAFPRRTAVEIGYDESLAHRLHAGADIIAHGSRFEPCGLAQMYAMRYGTVPVVTRVGGLGDSVVDFQASPESATGFVFEERTGDAYERAIERALAVYAGRPDVWDRLRRNALAADFGWKRSALEYCAVYGRLTGTVPMPDEAGALARAERVVALRRRLLQLQRSKEERASDAKTG